MGGLPCLLLYPICVTFIPFLCGYDVGICCCDLCLFAVKKLDFRQNQRRLSGCSWSCVPCYDNRCTKSRCYLHREQSSNHCSYPVLSISCGVLSFYQLPYRIVDICHSPWSCNSLSTLSIPYCGRICLAISGILLLSYSHH